jgi:predicted DsbA family dithiol-disulfide isomerase
VATIDVFAEMACPFTHAGLHRLQALLAERGMPVSFRIHAWPLEWVNGRPLDPELVGHEIDALRAQLDLDLFKGYAPEVLPRTSIPAFGLAAAAYDVDEATGTAVSLRLRHSLFEEGRDLTDPAVLATIGAELDVAPPSEAAARAAVERDHAAGRARGVVGSPHFFVGDRGWFCPLLQITKLADGTLRVRIDQHATDEFLTEVVAAAGAPDERV